MGDISFVGGHYYSDKAPGLALLAVPVYAALRAAFPDRVGTGYWGVGKNQFWIGRDTVYLRYAITYILVVIPSALLSIGLWLLLIRILGSSGWALGLAATYALGTIAFPYSGWFFSHQIAAALLFSSFLLIFHRIRDRVPDGRALSAAAVAGLLSGYAFVSEYPTIVIGTLLGAYLVWVSKAKLRAATAYIGGAIPAVALLPLYDWVAFGNAFTTGYSHLHSSMYRSNVHGGIIGLAWSSIRLPTWSSIWEITFGTYRGIFLVCPFLLLFIVGIVHMHRDATFRAEFWLCVVAVTSYFLMDASRGVDQSGWSGGWSIASRHLVPVLPFMIVPIAFALRSPRVRILFVPLAAISIAMMSAAVATGGFFMFSDHNPIVHELLPNVFHGNVNLNWGYLVGLRGLTSLCPYFLLAIGLVSRIIWVHRNVAVHEAKTVPPVLTLQTS